MRMIIGLALLLAACGSKADPQEAWVGTYSITATCMTTECPDIGIQRSPRAEVFMDQDGPTYRLALCDDSSSMSVVVDDGLQVMPAFQSNAFRELAGDPPTATDTFVSVTYGPLTGTPEGWTMTIAVTGGAVVTEGTWLITAVANGSIPTCP